MPKDQFGSPHFQPDNGAYAGRFSSTTNVTGMVIAQLTQTSADPDSQFAESGPLILTTPSCTNTFTVNGLVTGPTFSASLIQSTIGNTSTAFLFAAGTPDATRLSIPASNNILSASCNAGFSAAP